MSRDMTTKSRLRLNVIDPVVSLTTMPSVSALATRSGSTFRLCILRWACFENRRLTAASPAARDQAVAHGEGCAEPAIFGLRMWRSAGIRRGGYGTYRTYIAPCSVPHLFWIFRDGVKPLPDFGRHFSYPKILKNFIEKSREFCKILILAFFTKKYLRFVKIFHRKELCAGFLPHEQIFLHPPGGGSSPCRRQGFHEKEKTG